ncbi:MAG: hypothetical protein QM535_03610 [Limnohabitans sp.]|nr:hypothetical protein [Limnohabitans sp.]
MKNEFIKGFLIKIFHLLSILFFIDLIIFVFFGISISGFDLERLLFFIPLLIAFFNLKEIKNNRINKIIFFLLTLSPLIYIIKSDKISTLYEIKLTKNLKLRENLSLETIPFLSIYEYNIFFEKEISLKNPTKFDLIDNNLAEFDSVKIEKVYQDSISISLFKNSKKNKEVFIFDSNKIKKRQNAQ